MVQDEKILLLGSLFHDIGKFEQRVLTKHIPHSELGKLFFDTLKVELIKILGDKTAFERARKIITEHHTTNFKEILVGFTKQADYLSASQRVDFDKEDDWKNKWSHKFMTSLFSKIYINDSNSNSRKMKYYSHQLLTKKNYKILIPQYETEKDIKESEANYAEDTFDKFANDVRSVLSYYKNKEDFNTVINLLLVVFEKYMWCIPDFTGSENTDISLFNHLKDVAGLSHAIFKSQDTDSNNLNLIIGDIPGIQKYIFNVANKRPAKILRGRSIFVQILTRQFATIILEKLDLTDASLIMLAGGKFYIIAQSSKDFDVKFNEAKKNIENILIKNFNYQLSFSSVAHQFDFNNLRNKNITFGDIIDEASYKLLLKRNQPFENVLFAKNDFDKFDFILNDRYIEPDNGSSSNSIKCAVTDLPIRENHIGWMRDGKEQDENGGKVRVDKQVENEYKIGEKAPKSNVIVELSEDFSEVLNVKQLNEFNGENKSKKLLINPDLDELLNSKNIKKDILRNTQILEVANYTSKDDNNKNIVMDFGDMEEKNDGAKFMTLIKGDVDNLGLIMSSGLVGNKDLSGAAEEPKDLTGISRTTTLSNHLKYFFSFSLNGFLEDWEAGRILDENEKNRFPENDRIPGKESKDFKNYIKDRKIYTVFAGGDDLMLICPQSSALKLVNTLNKTFNDFVCENPEVHISYSLTNFKHDTPIRIVADMAEESQEKIKTEFKSKFSSDKKNVFYAENNKAGIRLFNTNVKNERIKKILDYKQNLIKWENDDDNPVSQGIFRNLLYFSKIMKDFNEKKDTRLLMWHPKLNYMINRLLKDKNGKYQDKKVESFFEKALKINKTDKPEAQLLEKILYPVICEAIYGTRNYKGE